MKSKYVNILNKIKSKKNLKIGIIGMGYVGLPLALTIAETNYTVFGFDRDKKKILTLLKKKSYINHISEKRVKRSVEKKKFLPTSNFNFVKQADFIIICVPTPLNNKRKPDLSHIKNSIENLQKFDLSSKVIILESTTYPGTCKEYIINSLNKKNFRESEDYFVCYSPEREDPGNKKYSTKNIPKVLGAASKQSFNLGNALYSKIFKKIVRVDSLEVAEATKIYENVFRSINIALVNELKFAFKKLNINIWDVIKASSTKPFGFMPFFPGPGLGGHCIPIDPIYLSWKCEQHGFDCNFIKLAEKINSNVPKKIINFVNKICKKISTKKIKILIIGLAYKKNIDDYRESPSLYILSKLLKKFDAKYHDNFIKIITKNRHYPNLTGLRSINLNKKNLKNFDLAILLTDHDYINYELIKENVKFIIDTRNAFSSDDKIFKL